MACSHATTCPLHPHLNHSLGKWREHYCDSEAGWRDCARYQKSLSGESMPLALLPNGKMVRGMDVEAQPAPVAEAPAAAATATAVLTDDEAERVLVEAQTTKPSFWRRFTNLFRVS